MSSGTVFVGAMKDNDYEYTEFPGTRAGIQAAIDFLAGGKGKVFIGPGTVLLDSALTLASYLTLEGSGWGVTILKHSGTTLHTMISGSSKTFWKIRHLTLDGDQTGVSSYDSDRWNREEAIDLSSCTDFEIEQVEMTAHRGQAIYGTSCARVTVRGCYIHDTDNWGAVFKVASDMDFLDNHIENIYTHGIDVDAQTDAAGSNRIRYIGNTAINCQHDSSHSDSGIGFSVQRSTVSGATDVIIVGNHSKNNGAMGFSIVPGKRSDGYAGKCVVMGNHSEGHTSNSGYGYECIATNAVFSGNTAKNNNTHFPCQNSKGVVYSGNKTISAVGSSQIAFIIVPAGTSDWVEDVTYVGNNVIGGTGFQISSTATSTPHTRIAYYNNVCVGCENGILFQIKASIVEVVGNMIDNSDSSVSVGRGIRAGADSILIAHNLIKTKTTANGIELNIVGGIDNISMIGNVVTQSAFPFQSSQTVTTLYASGNNFTAGSSGTFSTKNNVTNWRDAGNNSWNYVTAAPAAEYWHVGTKVYDTAVAPSSFIGWVCTTAGTPGTWKTWGAVSA